MSEVYKKIQDYLATNHNKLFNDDLTEKQSINDLLFDLFQNEILTGDKKATIRKQKAKYLKSLQISPETNNNTELENIQQSKPIQEIEKNINISKDYDNIITSLQESLQNHNNQITELFNRITELESKEIKTNLPEPMNNNNLQSQIAKNDLLNTEKTRYTFYITNNNIDYLKAFAKENNNISITSIINFMITQFKNNYPITSEPKPIQKELF